MTKQEKMIEEEITQLKKEVRILATKIDYLFPQHWKVELEEEIKEELTKPQNERNEIEKLMDIRCGKQFK